jgi:very-short-patch-repair endonuclease
MLLFSKPTRKKKPRKPLRRSLKKIAKRSVFKALGDNAFKSYRRRYTDYQVMVRAEVSRQARLRNRTRAEMAFCELLDSRRILYEIEKIFLNGDRCILADFFLKDRMLAIEIDGSSHDGQKKYDAGRDDWLLRTYGVRTIRIHNSTVFRKPAEAIAFLFES